MRRPSFWERVFRRRGERDSVRKALLRGASWSGKEPNHFFLNLGGRQFKDISAVAGLDDIADGRSFGILDYDRDGWLDFAVANKNEPRVELFRNGIGRLSEPSFIAVRLVGGNTTDRPSRWSTRSGYGARLTVRTGDLELVREHRCGEGFAAQNSAAVQVGLAGKTQADLLSVRWPSGRVQQTTDVPAGSLVTVYENPENSPTGRPFVLSPYLATEPIAPQRAESTPRVRSQLTLAALATSAETPRLRLVTTLATWCVPCRREVPVLTALRQRFSETDLGLFGVAIDPEDGAEALAEWNTQLEPPYRIVPVSDDERENVQRLVAEQLGTEAVPATLILNPLGELLHAQWGPPTVSTLRRLLDNPL